MQDGTNQLEGPDSVMTTTQTYVEKDLSSNAGDELTKTFPGTLSIGPAFNLDLVLAKRGCINCDKSLYSKITVNQKDYNSAIPEVDSFKSEIEEISGFMLSHEKKVSVYIQLKTDQCLPFPSLDPIGKQLIPLYDVNENLDLDIGEYQSSFGFIDHTIKKRRKATIACITIAVVFFLLSIAGVIFAYVCNKRTPLSYSEVG